MRPTNGPKARRIALLATSAAAAGFIAVSADAATIRGCHLSVETSPSSTWAINNYNPFVTQAATAQYSVRVLNDGDAPCDRNLSVVTDGETYGLLGPNGERLNYSLYATSDSVNMTPTRGSVANSQAVLHFTLLPSSRRTFTYSFGVNLVNLPSSGAFDQRVSFQMDTRPGANNDYGPASSTPVTLSLNVASAAVISLRGTFKHAGNGGAQIDLGELKAGSIQEPIQLFVQSTTGYALALHSLNNGVLKLGATSWTVPYSISLGANTINLAGTPGLTVPAGGAARQDSLPISFTIGDPSNKAAGNYSDVITVSVTAD